MMNRKIFTYGVIGGMTVVFLLNRTYKGRFVRDIMRLHTSQLLKDIKYGLSMKEDD